MPRMMSRVASSSPICSFPAVMDPAMAMLVAPLAAISLPASVVLPLNSLRMAGMAVMVFLSFLIMVDVGYWLGLISNSRARILPSCWSKRTVALA